MTTTMAPEAPVEAAPPRRLETEIEPRNIPAELLAGSKNFRPQCVGIRPPWETWSHICGSDLIRDHRGNFAGVR